MSGGNKPVGARLAVRTLGLLALSLVFVAGCGGDATEVVPELAAIESESGADTTQAPTSTASASPASPPVTASPTPVGDFDWDSSRWVWDPGNDPVTAVFGRVANGDGVSEAALYAGEQHPMVLLHIGEGAETYIRVRVDEAVDLVKPPYIAEVQLVALITYQRAEPRSCGEFTTTDGTTGEVLLVDQVTNVEIRAAHTGEPVAEKVFTIEAGPCPGASSTVGMTYPVRGDPPWESSVAAKVYGEPDLDLNDDVTDWVNGFLTGPARTQ
jgi:hypothetical protein